MVYGALFDFCSGLTDESVSDTLGDGVFINGGQLVLDPEIESSVQLCELVIDELGELVFDAVAHACECCGGTVVVGVDSTVGVNGTGGVLVQCVSSVSGALVRFEGVGVDFK